MMVGIKMGLTDKKNTTAVAGEMVNNARVIWGEPKTVKSGLALDFPNKQIYVLDWDDGCEPTWRQNHECSDRITLWNPEIRNQNGELDIQKSEANSEDFVLFVKSKIEQGEDVLFVFDGIDKWLDCTVLFFAYDV